MENMKMSDVWNKPITYDVYDNAEVKGNVLPTGFGMLFNNEEPAIAVCHAVNNHDRLVEENAELREMLKKFIPSNNYYETNEDDEDGYCNHGGTFEYNEDSEHIGLEVVNLLAKHK